MSGKCSTLKVAERDFSCNTVAFSHSPGGRFGFTVPLNDPEDDTHIITFSGEKSKREHDNQYELSIDRMLLKSKDRPRSTVTDAVRRAVYRSVQADRWHEAGQHR
jgi:hypothetical protein